MSAPPKDLAQAARQWLELADEDLLLAQHGLLLGDQAPWRLVAYHAQQSAEKCLKAFLVWRGIDFPYTHNIARLLELLSPLAPWADSLVSAATLTPFAISARYPGQDLQVTGEEARQAITVAEQVRATVRRALAAENPDLFDAWMNGIQTNPN
jgi:HEPN domain-containing protein